MARFHLPKILVTPGFNLDRFEREHFLPIPSNPQFVMSNDRWRAEHSPKDDHELHTQVNSFPRGQFP